jgi:hypothetical protein
MRRYVACAAAIAVAAPMGALSSPGAGTAGADGPTADGAGAGGTVLPFNQTFRRCDHSIVNSHGPTAYGIPYGMLYTSGNRIVADVQIYTARPFTQYDVRLIQMPRPSSATCFGGDPGVAIAALNTDRGGVGAASVSGEIAPGATGVWVYITRPDPFSQQPAEFYSTDLVVDI